MKQILIILSLLLSAPLTAPGTAEAADKTTAWFKDAPIQYRSWPLYWPNAPLDSAALREQIQARHDACGFGGFSPLILRTAKPNYLTVEYFARYGLMLEAAEQLGLKVICSVFLTGQLP